MERLNKINFSELSEPEVVIKKEGKSTIRYLNSANAFDIETSSFYDNNGNKRACMYLFMFCIDGTTFYGRTWAEFRWVLQELQIRYQLDYYKRMVIYVHNLAYEFQFLINRAKLYKIFARKKRHPIKCLVEEGLEFRCSYFLSGLSLAKTAEEITDINIEKKEGDLDYRKIRHQLTPLTDDELQYGEYDVLCVYHFIRGEIKKNGDITKVPLTKTGYVRKYCREYIRTHTNYGRYREKILKEAPTDKELFILLNRAFAGGYTHANCNYIFDEVENVYSIDFTSSYPTQMIAHKFPRGKFIKRNVISIEQFYEFINTYACVFEIKLKNVTSKTAHHIWSVSKCKYGTTKHYNAVNDNGRIVCSDEIYTYMTDVDFINFSKFYKFEIEEINNMWCTYYSYLPKQLIECVLKFYGDKTTLKGVIGKEDFYLIAKGMLNALYGMCVTNPINDDILFDDEEWKEIEPDMEDALEKAYNNQNQFLCYQWGVWITAWARYELLSGVLEINDDVLYCDTDSIKFVNYNKHKKYIEDYNRKVGEKLKTTLDYYDIDFNLTRPKTIKGKEKPLGVWDCEFDFDEKGKAIPSYDKFKTLGAKRYMTEKGGKLHMTVSGLSNVYMYEDDYKKECEKNGKEYTHENWEKLYKYTPLQYIIDHGGLEFFDDEMLIPATYSRRLTHSYKEEYYTCLLTDYTGISAKVEEFCYIHLEPSEFRLSFATEFINFLEGINDGIAQDTWFKRDEIAIRPAYMKGLYYGDVTTKE